MSSTMTKNYKKSTKGSVYRQWLMGFLATVTFLTYGLQSGWMSPFIIVLQSENSPAGYSLSNNEISIIASAISFLAVASAAIFGYIADILGRRMALVLVAIPQILGFALKLVSANPICLIISQAFCGIAGGGVYCVAPVYIKEIAQDSLRGVLESSAIMLQNLGVMIMYAMGAYMEYNVVHWTIVWVPVLNLLALFIIPESPDYLVKKGKMEEATKVMAWLRGVDEDDKEVKRDISVTKNEIAAYDNLPPVSWKSMSTVTFLTYGLQSGWMSPFIIVLQSENSPAGYSLSNNEISIIASAISFLAVASAAIFGYIADILGRRMALVLVAIPQILGFALKLVSANPICLIISQAFCGIAGGGVYCVAPVYIKEIAQDSLRGVLESSAIMLQNLGVMIMYAMGAYMEYNVVHWTIVWVPVLNLLALFIIPESPDYLVKKGKMEEATKVMAWLRGVDEDDKEVKRDISVTKNEIAAYDNLPPVSWKSMLSEKATRKSIYLSFLLITLLDMGGSYAIISYASLILRNAGVTIASDLQALSFPFLMTLGTLLSAATVDKYGRKPIILISAIFTGAPLAVLGGLILAQDYGISIPFWAPVLCIGICLYASGQQMALPYVVMSEMFSIQTRTKVLGLLVTYSWALCAVQTILFTTIIEYFGMHSSFFGFAFINAMGVILCYLQLPETKGKTQEQIYKELEGLKE